jgi:hypothetical protein
MATVSTELKRAGSALLRELQNRMPPGMRLNSAVDQIDSGTGGYMSYLGSLGRSRTVELWLDTYLGRPEPCFWFGFAASRPEVINELIESCKARNKPCLHFTGEDTELTSGGEYRFKKPFRDSQLNTVVHEEYKQDRRFYLGMFDSAYRPSRDGSRLDVSRAASFLYEVATDLVGDTSALYWEGPCEQVTRNAYERSAAARRACVASFGYDCVVCQTNFQKIYGPELGRNFIHVHHLEPLGGRTSRSLTAGRSELVPVCPNCHAMLHRRTPPIKPEELSRLVKQNRSAV